MQVVEPADRDRSEAFSRELRAHGVAMHLADGVADALFSAGMLGDGVVEEAHAGPIAEVFDPERPDDEGLVRLLAMIAGCGPSGLADGETDICFRGPEFIRLAQRLRDGPLGHDMHRGLETLRGSPRLRLPELLGLLVEAELVDPTRILDKSAIRRERGRLRLGRHRLERSDPRDVGTWLDACGERLFGDLVSILRAEPVESVASFASGFLNLFTEWASRTDLGPIAEHGIDPSWDEIGPALRPWFAELERRRRDEGMKERALTQLWWRFAWRSFGGEPGALAEGSRREVVRSAQAELRRLAAWLRTADPETSASEASERFHALTDACLVIGRLEGLWGLLKPLLLVFRAAPVACVANDLRPWCESTRADPPEPWSWIPTHLTGAVHAFAVDEERRDPELTMVRSQLARFLLDRLTTPKRERGGSSSGPAERDPVWRAFCVRAVMSLHVNPAGRGHQTLHHARKNDPDERVRAVADRAYRRIRQTSGLPENQSPRRALITALWWLRQAHLIQHGCPIDEDGARRTLMKEVRYATRPTPRV